MNSREIVRRAAEKMAAEPDTPAAEILAPAHVAYVTARAAERNLPRMIIKRNEVIGAAGALANAVEESDFARHFQTELDAFRAAYNDCAEQDRR